MTAATRTILRQISKQQCALCRQQGQYVPATCAILGKYAVSAACDACGEKAKAKGKAVIFKAARALPLVG